MEGLDRRPKLIVLPLSWVRSLDYDNHPRSELPHDRGTYRYVPSENEGRDPRGTSNGYVDEHGNEWIWKPSRYGVCAHWDVQHPDADYSNIAPTGETHHGTTHPEHFP